ncbi:hypothetical protein EDF77_2880 [Stenotrophomonas maltophilia]|uniref:hypothetical protein n=1 Tax=Stenotrophomonas chelatiphaga TaxID=517011 RepID=UPI000F4B4125|nr:hypothetical protein [Stenotrophomonas chelatiphaga]MCS4231152.1 hypothetical protein [Stenotrophomonas chelatiphaga]ROQ39057.1 hypothetical protein EDF77_2880 [Stenotrophomonas maltophilia]
MRDLHDHRITGLHLNESSNTLTVSLTDAEGQRGADLVLVNIVDLYVDGFSLQNIILDASVFHEKSTSFEYQRACQLLDIDSANASTFADSRTVILIQASAGAEIACLASGRIAI